MDNKLLYKFFFSIIQLIMTYACTAWNFTADTNVKKLQLVQNEFLRIIGD